MKTITLETRDKFNRIVGECTWKVGSRFNECLDRRERWFTLLGGFGYDFGTIETTGTRRLPVGEGHGIVRYEWPMHWTEREAI